MGTDIIQADYDRLEHIAQRFGQQSSIVAELCTRLQRQAENLVDLGWQGDAADAFIEEIDIDVLPGLGRLADALGQAQTETNRITTILQAAEEEAAEPFRRYEDGPPVDGGDGGESTGPDNITPENTPHEIDDQQVRDQFDKDKMDELIGYEPSFADQEKMAKTMQALFRTPPLDPDSPEVKRLLAEMADAYGSDVTPEYLQDQYEKYFQLAHEAYDRMGEWPPGLVDKVAEINVIDHSDYWGSTWQMRYGKVAGDALGIDPVFGAMLNPTGGLVGPGNLAFEAGLNDGVGYHGTFHDAAGYLHNAFDKGPGYDYLGEEPHRDTSNPLTGQTSGIPYWEAKLPSTEFSKSIVESVEMYEDGKQRIAETYERTKQQVTETYEDVKDGVAETYENAKEDASDAWDTLTDIFDF